MSETLSPYPSNDQAIELPSGRTIRFYDLIVLRGFPQPGFSVHYGSKIERNRGEARQAEATEVIEHFCSMSSCRDATRANASICSTPAQAATKELPEEIFQFERSENGDWVFVGRAELPPRTA